MFNYKVPRPRPYNNGGKKEKSEKKYLGITHNEWGLIINAVGVIVSIVAVILAYKLFNETIVANQTTKDALTHQIRKDSIQGLTDSMKFNRDTTLFSAQLKAWETQSNNDKNMINSQILTLKQEQDRFEIQNKSFIEVRNPTFVLNNTDITYKINVVNMGSYPIEVLYYRIVPIYMSKLDSLPTVGKVIKMHPYIYANSIVTSSNPIPLTIEYSIPNNIYNALIEKNIHVVLSGEIYYRNPSIKKNGKYEFVLYFDKKDFTLYNLIHGLNVPLAKSYYNGMEHMFTLY